MEKRFRKNFSAEALVWTLLLLLATLPAASAWRNDDDDDDDQPPRFSDWSIPVNLGPPVNTIFLEQGVSISKDGLSLYFQSDRPGGLGGQDIYVAQRDSLEDPWGEPQNLGPAINTSATEGAPRLSRDGHRLYFHSDGPGGLGGFDLYVSRRRHKRDDFGWQPPENLGSGVNTAANEEQPDTPFEDDATGATTLYFVSNRPGGLGFNDIYASTLGIDGTFGPALPVSELNTSRIDQHPNLSKDGLVMLFSSNRPGSVLNPLGQPSVDLWFTTRIGTADPWSTPVNLGPVVNSTLFDGRPALSFDGTTLYFLSNRAGGVGGFDLYVTRRTKLKDRDDDDDDHERGRSDRRRRRD